MRGLAFLRRYLEHQMDLGNLRPMDAGAAARCFVGPLVAYVITRELFVQPDAETLTPDKMVESLVEIYLHGMEPSEHRAHASIMDDRRSHSAEVKE